MVASADLRFRVRLLYLLCVGLFAAAVVGWWPAEQAATLELQSAGEVEELKQRISRAGYAERVRLLHQLGQLGHQSGRAAEVIAAIIERGSRHEKLNAIAELGRLGTDGAIEQLSQLAQSGSGLLRKAAITAMGSSHGERAVAVLHELLDDASLSGERGRVVAALGRAGGERAARTLAVLAAEPSSFFRSDAIAALGVTGHPLALKPLERLLDDPLPAMQQAAVAALGRLGSDEAKRALIALVQSGTKRLKPLALRALGHYGGDDVEVLVAGFLNSSDRRLASIASDVLGRSGGALAQQTLRTALVTGSKRQREDALRALARQGTPESRELLIAQLKDPQLVQAAVSALSELEDPRARAALVEVARSDRPWAVREAAVAALSNKEGDKASLETMGQLVKGADPRVAARALQHLAQSQGRAARPMLEEAYKNGPRALRRTAMSALAELGDPRNRELFVSALKSGDYTLSHHATLGLAKIGDPEARRQLTELARSGPRSVRSEVTMAVARLGGEESQKLLFEQVRKGEVNSWALAELRGPAVSDKLRQMFDDPQLKPYTRTQIVGAMMHRGDIQEVLSAATHPDPTVARAAVRSLAGIGGADAERVLLQATLSNDDATRQDALNALGQLGSHKAVSALVSATDRDKDFSQAVRGLAQIESKPALEALSQRFTGGSAEQKEKVLWALSSSRAPRAQRVMFEALDDPSARVVAIAANQLANRGGLEVGRRLLSTLQNSDDDKLRRALAGMLRRSGGQVYRQNRELIDELLR